MALLLIKFKETSGSNTIWETPVKGQKDIYLDNIFRRLISFNLNYR